MSCREDKARYLLTQSLLAAWQYNISGGPQEEFLRVLRREKTEQTQAMKDGIEFERLVWECACGKEPEEKHKWAKGVREITEIVRGGRLSAYPGRESGNRRRRIFALRHSGFCERRYYL